MGKSRHRISSDRRRSRYCWRTHQYDSATYPCKPRSASTTTLPLNGSPCQQPHQYRRLRLIFICRLAPAALYLFDKRLSKLATLVRRNRMEHRIHCDNSSYRCPTDSNNSPPDQFCPLRPLGLGKCNLALAKSILRIQKTPQTIKSWSFYIRSL